MYYQITEMNYWERETWHYFLKNNKKDKNLALLIKSIKKHKPDSFILKEINDEEFKKKSKKNNNTTYKGSINVIDKVIPPLDYNNPDLLYDVLYKGKIFDRFYLICGDQYRALIHNYKLLNIIKNCGLDVKGNFISHIDAQKLLSDYNNIKSNWKIILSDFRKKVKLLSNNSEEYKKLNEKVLKNALFEQDSNILQVMLELSVKSKKDIMFF